LSVGPHSITATFAGNGAFAASVSSPLCSRSRAQDSIKLRNLQVVATRMPRKNAGQAISGTIEAAISEGFCRRRSVDYAERTRPSLTSSGQGKERSDWLLWSDLRQTSMNPGGASRISAAIRSMAFVGLTYRGSRADGIVGVFGGYETLGYDVSSLSGHLRGDGRPPLGYVGCVLARRSPRRRPGAVRNRLSRTAGDRRASFTGSRHSSRPE